jgi:5-methyltetrahydropteroyltriglutamate--homocysteine methyltransferase
MAIAPLPRVKARLHVWWGNYEGPYERDVDLADIWSEIAKANARSYFVSMANSRYAHGYRLFERAALRVCPETSCGIAEFSQHEAD